MKKINAIKIVMKKGLREFLLIRKKFKLPIRANIKNGYNGEK